jgi:hypothetical protein
MVLEKISETDRFAAIRSFPWKWETGIFKGLSLAGFPPARE